MANLTKVKLTLINDYFKYVRKLKSGHPQEGYGYIKEAMLKINYIENYDVPQWQKDVVINSISVDLSNN